MAKFKLSIEQQIEILKLSREEIMCNNHNLFICIIIMNYIHKIYGVFPTVDGNLIKRLNRTNAKKVCKANKVPIPEDDYAWWEGDNKESRIVFIDWLIAQLENDLLINNTRTSI